MYLYYTVPKIAHSYAQLLMYVHHSDKKGPFHACDVEPMAVAHNEVLWNSKWLPETQTDCLLS